VTPRHCVALAFLALVGCTDAQPCPSPLEVCGGVCVDLSSDPRHCGGCGASCAAGRSCQASTCSDSIGVSCAVRSGGAFVVLAKCAQTVKLWTTSAAFIDRAEALRDDPASPGNGVPVLELLEGADCDGQWTWHADPQLMRFDSVKPPEDCDACPALVEAEKAYRVTTVGVWCPLSSRVLAVDRQP
jgi:hypothetical protein